MQRWGQQSHFSVLARLQRALVLSYQAHKLGGQTLLRVHARSVLGGRKKGEASVTVLHSRPQCVCGPPLPGAMWKD